MSGGYELLEHTADIGIHAWGDTPEAAFEQAAWGLVDVLGARAPRVPGGPAPERVAVVAAGEDRAGLLVAFLNEVLFVHEVEEVAFEAIRVERVTDEVARAEVEVIPLVEEPDGVAVKAATYHQIEVGAHPDGGTELRVYLDV